MSSNYDHNGSTYDDHIEREIPRYVAEFEAFWDRLDPKQRKLLVENGIEGPVIEFSTNAGLDHDVADTPAASYTEDLARKIDNLADQLIEKFGIRQRTAISMGSFIVHTIEQESIAYKAWLFGKVCGVMLNATNPKITAGALAFAANLNSLNELGSMRQYARQIGVSVEAISKEKRHWEIELLLPASPHSKSPAARANYKKAATENHWRNRKCTREALQQLRMTSPSKTT